MDAGAGLARHSVLAPLRVQFGKAVLAACSYAQARGALRLPVSISVTEHKTGYMVLIESLPERPDGIAVVNVSRNLRRIAVHYAP